MKNIEWKKIVEYPDYYISNEGSIKRNGKNLTLVKGNHGYYQIQFSIGGKRHIELLHRLVAQYFIPNKNGKTTVDHIDGDRLNNSVNNLRWADTSENGANSKKRKNTTSKYKGVSWFARDKNWRVQITHNYINKHIGYFDTQEEAAEAYDEAAKIIFGTFSKTNTSIQALLKLHQQPSTVNVNNH